MRTHRTTACKELIETLWNVNKEILISNTQDIIELIETLWNVNDT